MSRSEDVDRSALMCFLCEKSIDDDTENNEPTFAECDECENNFHPKCFKASVKDLKARKGSKCLRLFCPLCVQLKDNSASQKFNELLKWVQKLDLFNQVRIPQIEANNEFIKSMASKIDNVEKLITSNGPRASVSNNNNIGRQNAQPSYASIAKKTSVKPAVVIKPKAKQDSKKTLEAVTTNIDKKSVNVCGTRSVRDGGVVLRCVDAKETMKVKQLVSEKLGDGYEVILPKIKNPRLRVTNIAPDIKKESIIDELKKHNDGIKDIEMKFVTVINRKATSRKTESNEIVVEVNGAAHQKLLEMGILHLPWRECRVLEHVYLKRCYKCLGFSHIAKDCTGDQKCSKCGGNHKFSDCKSKSLCCANCRSQNVKHKTKLDTKHHAWSKECTVYKQRTTSFVNNIEYNASE